MAVHLVGSVIRISEPSFRIYCGSNQLGAARVPITSFDHAGRESRQSLEVWDFSIAIDCDQPDYGTQDYSGDQVVE